MYGQQEVSVFEAKIQSEVAQFLTLKERLLGLSSFSEPKISDEAKVLMSTQVLLEKDLPAMKDELMRLKEGKIDLSQLPQLVYYGYMVESHISDVQDLEDKAKELGYKPSAAFAIPWTMVVLTGVAVILVYAAFRGR